MDAADSDALPDPEPKSNSDWKFNPNSISNRK
jgi:hypothetical protein